MRGLLLAVAMLTVAAAPPVEERSIDELQAGMASGAVTSEHSRNSRRACSTEVASATSTTWTPESK